MRRVFFGLVAVVVVLPLLALAIFILRFDPNRYAPRLVAAVAQATGRRLVLGSPIALKFSLEPTVEVRNVSLANPPGFADADFLTLQTVDARIALWPLLSRRIDIKTLIMTGPDIVLETNQAGQADWDFSRSAAPGPAVPSGVSDGHGRGFKVALESVEIQNGLLTIRNAKGVRTGSLTLTDLRGKANSPSAPLNLAATAAYNGLAFTLNGQLGPVERFSGIGGGPWPVDLSLAANGASARLQGFFAQPRQAAGYEIAVAATIPALEAFNPWVAAYGPLPPIHGITFTGHLADQGSAMPAISGVSIKAGASDLSAFWAGLSLSDLDIEIPSLNQQPSLDTHLALNLMPILVTANTGPVSQLLNPTWLPATAQPGQGNFPITLQVQTLGGRLAVTGGIATPANLSGVALGLNVSIPELSSLAALPDTALPSWKNITLQTTLIDPGGLGLMKAVGLDSLVVSMDNAAFGGDANFYFGPRPRLEIALKGQQINLDALLAAMPAPRPEPAPTGTATATPQTRPAMLTTDLNAPILRTGSADIQLAADTLIYNHATYTALQGHAVLANGVLTLDPLTAVLPGGSVAAHATLDAGKAPAAASVSVNAPALALAPFLKALDLPDAAQGTVQAVLNANATGDTPRAMLASVNGELGLAAVNGVIDGAVLRDLLGATLAAVGLPADLVGAQGPVAVRCFGLRMDASAGVGTVRALTLDSSRLLLQGGGSVDFGDQTLALILRPQLRIAGSSLGVPVQIGGTFSTPTTEVAPLSALRNAGRSALGLPMTLAQQVAQGGSVLGTIAGDLGLGAGDVCPAALNLARLGNPGPAAPPAGAAPAESSAPRLPGGPQNLLNALLK